METFHGDCYLTHTDFKKNIKVVYLKFELYDLIEHFRESFEHLKAFSCFCKIFKSELNIKKDSSQ